MDVLSSDDLNNNTLFDVVEMLETVDIQKVGCEEHNHALTIKIIHFFLLMRMNFAASRFNKIHIATTTANREKTKMLRKQAKMI